MWIVLLALRRPYTFVVMAILMVFGGIYTIRRTPTDILPEVDIPVISVVWTYGGLPAQQVEQQITQFSEFSLSGNVSDIQSIQSEARLAVDSIGQISLIVSEFAEVQSTIASAIEEQTATTNEISRNVTEVAKGSGEIAQTITAVASSAQSTSAGAINTQKAAADLAHMAGELQNLVGQFTR